MTRIVYISPFAPTEISGGIKVMFRHVEMLRDMGFDAFVFSPHGRPTWMETRAPLFSGPDLLSNPDHLLVFPEVLNGGLAQLAAAPARGRKALLCQNQYQMFSECFRERSPAELGFSLFLTVGRTAKGFLDRVFAPARFDVVPVWIDAARFRACEKRPAIAFFPRKLPVPARLIREIFERKHPRFRSVQWQPIHDRSEAETAAILGRASVFLSLCAFECAPLSPLEAMASGCLVAGFHGYGGLDYATQENGLWLPPDHLEETADALARLLDLDAAGDPEAARRRAAGHETAARYNDGATREALRRIYQPLCVNPALRDLDALLGEA